MKIRTLIKIKVYPLTYTIP